MERYTISVIVPVYNTSKYIDKCLNSLVAQDYSALEIFLVDDGSTDGSSDICDNWANKDERIRVIHKQNGGLVSAWKEGVKNSSGRYLAFVDSDDWVDASLLKELSSYLSGDDAEIISSDYIIERKNKDSYDSEYVYQIISPGIYEEKELKEKIIPLLLGNEYRYVAFSRCMKLISRELIENNMHYSPEGLRMGEDVSVIYPSLLDCRRLVIPDHLAMYHYLYVTESMVHSYSRTLEKDIKNLTGILSRVVEDKRETLYPGTEAKVVEGLKKETVYLLFLIIKNEVRGNAKEYRKNIKSLAGEYSRLVRETKVPVTSLANKLIYKVLLNPNPVNLLLLRLAVLIKYR